KTIVRSDLVAGDTTGQWNLYVDWFKTKRLVTKLIRRNPELQMIDGESPEDIGLEDDSEEIEDTEEKIEREEGPEVIDFATEDLAVVPPTCTNLQKAHAVSLILRMSPSAVREMVDEGVFILPEDTDIEAFCNGASGNSRRDRKPPPKKQTKAAG